MENKKIESFISSVKSNAELLRDTAKSRFALKKATDELNELFQQLGALTYNAGESEDSAEAVSILKDTIAAKRDEVAALQREYNALCGKTECDKCGKLVSIEYDFCPYCGEKIFTETPEEDTKEEEEETFACGDCSSCTGCASFDSESESSESKESAGEDAEPTAEIKSDTTDDAE